MLMLSKAGFSGDKPGSASHTGAGGKNSAHMVVAVDKGATNVTRMSDSSASKKSKKLRTLLQTATATIS